MWAFDMEGLRLEHSGWPAVLRTGLFVLVTGGEGCIVGPGQHQALAGVCEMPVVIVSCHVCGRVR